MTQYDMHIIVLIHLKTLIYINNINKLNVLLSSLNVYSISQKTLIV